MEQREYDIPLRKIGFYGTGLCDVKAESKQELSDLILPVRDFVIPLIDINPIHLSCRYLGYYDEGRSAEIQRVTAKVKSIFQQNLPVTVEGCRIFPGWHENPEHYRKLLMLDVSDPTLTDLHGKLLEVTADFPVFRQVEGVNFRPHFTLAEVKEEFANNIPMEVSDFICDFRKRVRVTFNNAFIWGKDGMKEF